MHDTIRMEVHVQHVQVDIQVLHEQRHKVVVIRHVVRDTLFQVQQLDVLNVRPDIIVHDEHFTIKNEHSD